MIDGEGASVEAGGATDGGEGGGAAEPAASRARSRAPVRGGPPPQTREAREPQARARAVPESEIKIAGFDDVDDGPAPKPRKAKERPAKEAEAETTEGDEAEETSEGEAGDADAGEQDEAAEDDWTPEKIAAEREALDERKKKLDRSHVAVTEKRRALAVRERAVIEGESRLRRETEAAGHLFQSQYGKIQAFDQIRELAQRSDPKLIEVLGLDIEKLSRYHAEEGTPIEADRRVGETLKQFQARLEEEKKAREAAEKRFEEAQAAQESVRGFVRLARQATGLTLVQKVLAADPDALVEEATKLRARGMAQGHDWHGDGLLRRLEGRLRRLAERNGQAYSIDQRAPAPTAQATGGPTTGKRPTVERAERGLGAEPRRSAPQSSPDPSSLDETQRTALAERSLADLWRKDRRR